MYISYKPTTGFYFDYVNKLVDLKNTVVLIEHNLDVIKTVDYVIDLGPEGGEFGGKIVAKGRPEEVAKNEKSSFSFL